MKKFIAVLVLLVLVCNGAFAMGFLGYFGWGAVIGGGLGMGVNLAMGVVEDPYTLPLIFMGSGFACILLDLLFSSSNDSSTAKVQSNPILEHVSFGAAPNAAYIGVKFDF